jgi:HEPN domain-containing protein
MSSHAKSLIIKAQSDLDLAKKHLDDEEQHDLVGYNLAQATEQLLKALCGIRGLSYPSDEDGHDLDLLVETLENGNFALISSHADIIDLTQYNSPKAYVREEDRLDLEEYYGYVSELKKLVGEQLKLAK